MNRFVYADNSATTALAPDVLEQMMPYLTEQYGNPSSLYSFASPAKEAVENAREKVAAALGAIKREIYFTAGGSESDNWAIKGLARVMKKKGKTHIISSAFEHHAVLHALNSLKSEGFEITLLPVHEDGLIRPEEFKNAIKPETGFATIMYANNEIGTIQPIEQLGKICREAGIIFHTDAVQAVGNLHIDVVKENIDLLSLSAHKFHGPKGVGALYCRKGIAFPNLIDGGAQERGRRAGTENVAGIVGLGAAIERANATIDERAERLSKIRDYFIDEALKIEKSRVNGSREHRLPSNVNMCFEGIEGESLLLMLDMKGICASSGSACTSGSLDPSHVLLAIGLKHEVAHGSLRLSFGEDASMEDAEYILSVLPDIVDKLRIMSPLWDRIKNN